MVYLNWIFKEYKTFGMKLPGEITPGAAFYLDSLRPTSRMITSWSLALRYRFWVTNGITVTSPGFKSIDNTSESITYC